MLLRPELLEDCDTVVLQITGGMGRNIMGTAVVRALKKAIGERELVVMAGCPDVFLKNPYVRRVLDFGKAVYFYEDYIMDKRTIVLNVEPYQHYDYIYRRKHFVECWCDMLGIECDGIEPELFFTENERRLAKIYLNQFDRDMVLIQHQGGKIPEDKSEKAKIKAKSEMYRRSLPEKTVQEVTDGLINRGFMVGSVGHPNQFLPSGAEQVSFPIRAMLALLLYVEEVICIDSFLLHGAAALKKKALVCWGGTNPKVLGYEKDVNLTREVCENPMCHRPNSYLFDVQPTGFLWECPWDDKCMDYSSNELLEEFDKMTGGKRGRTREERGEGAEHRQECRDECGGHVAVKLGETPAEEVRVEAGGPGTGAEIPASPGAD